MNIYLMRHAAALPIGGPVELDAERPLSPEGKAEASRVAARLKARGVVFDRIVSSTLLRARETAALLAPCGRPGLVPEKHPLLGAGFGVEGLKEVLQEGPPAEHILVVAHQPDLGYMVRVLAGGVRGFSPDRISPGTVHALQIVDWKSKPAASWLWVETP